MKAVVMRDVGPPDVLRWEEAPDPEPRDDEVVIGVRAVSVNRTLDVALRAGTYERRAALPHVLGADPVGEVIAVGTKVADRKVGQRVATFPILVPGSRRGPPQMLGVQVWGGYAERVVVPARATHPIPDGLDDPTACVVARHAPIAFTLLREKAHLQPQEWVLVMGAAGGLGACGVQAAKIMGARVIAAAGADERVAVARSLGADRGVNYRRDSLVDAVMEITGGAGVDVVFENVGDPEFFPQAVAALGRYGRLVTAGAHAGDMVQISLRRLYLNQLTLIGSTQQMPADLDLALAHAGDGRLTVPIERIMPMQEAAEAHRLLESREVSGKIVLVPE